MVWKRLQIMGTETFKWKEQLTGDRANLNSQLEHLQSKYVGTGHADTSKYEWGVNQARDTYASYIGHYPMISYFALAENESIARVKFNITEPCGPPPERRD
ncbi:hypothetical protein BGZ83_007234 [Gryganskiella cystojenkinii]|nr:hypothetical protein BGZ83_007234 [Gryganskiella cystojenkinii]